MGGVGRSECCAQPLLISGSKSPRHPPHSPTTRCEFLSPPHSFGRDKSQHVRRRPSAHSKLKGILRGIYGWILTPVSAHPQTEPAHRCHSRNTLGQRGGQDTAHPDNPTREPPMPQRPMADRPGPAVSTPSNPSKQVSRPPTEGPPRDQPTISPWGAWCFSDWGFFFPRVNGMEAMLSTFSLTPPRFQGDCSPEGAGIVISEDVDPEGWKSVGGVGAPVGLGGAASIGAPSPGTGCP